MPEFHRCELSVASLEVAADEAGWALPKLAVVDEPGRGGLQLWLSDMRVPINYCPWCRQPGRE